MKSADPGDPKDPGTSLHYTDQADEGLAPEGELAAADDRIIGRALSWSLVAMTLIAVSIAAGVFLARRPRAAGPERAIEVSGPQEVVPPDAPPEVRFANITAAAGIDFVHYNGAYGDKLLPETMGGGVAFLDYDNDLDPDLLFVNSAPWPWRRPPRRQPTMALYRNDGTGGFSDVTAEAGLAASFYGMGVAAGDFDGNGWVDLFFTAVGENRLFRNQGGHFVEATRSAGVGGDPEAWSSGAAFFDADNDGDLDLFVGNYVRWSREIDFELDYRLTGVGRAYGPPQNYQGTYPYLYRNNGDGTFTDVSSESGVQVSNPATGAPMAKTLGLGPVDVDRDGWMDLMVANDTVQNFFFHNRGDGTFEEAGEYFGLAYDRDGRATGAMGVDAAHYRNDANLGFFVGNFANEMTSIYVSQDDPTLFVDESISEGIGAPSRLMLTFGLFAFDYDLDGRLDLLQANGHLEEEINQVDPSQQYRQPAQLFWNAGSGSTWGFVRVPEAEIGDLARPVVGRGASYADIDGDGDLDVVLTQPGGAPMLLRNEQSLGHHWLRVKLVGRSPNRDAIGAWVELEAGGVTQRRQVVPTRSYLSQVELPVTFGLGQVDRLDALRVTWPDGTVEQIEDVVVDRLRVVEQGG